MAHPIPIHLRSDLLVKLCEATGEVRHGAQRMARNLVANAGRKLGAGSKLPRLPVDRF
jgi:hypothetical protein